MRERTLRRTPRTTRVQRRRREEAASRKRITWQATGGLAALALMTHFEMWDPMTVLAVLGSIEVASRAWTAIWDWWGA